MPRKYTKRSTAFRRRRKRFPRRVARRSYAPTNRGVMPIKYKTSNRYATVANLDATAVIPAVHVFRANDLYDPDFTGVGHQPRGFDELMAFYEKFTVIGGRVRVDIPCSDVNLMLYIGLSNTSTALNRNAYEELNNFKKVIVGGRSGTGSPRTVYFKYNPNKYLAVSKPLSESDLSGGSSASPTRQCYLHVAVASMDDTTDAPSHPVNVTLDYTSVYHAPKKLNQS